jgi:hypothetical protein
MSYQAGKNIPQKIDGCNKSDLGYCILAKWSPRQAIQFSFMY